MFQNEEITESSSSEEEFEIFEPPNCDICMQPLTGKLATTPCGHVFHEPCISEYLQYKPSCPKDRSVVKPEEIVKLFFEIKRVPAGGLKLSKTISKAFQEALSVPYCHGQGLGNFKPSDLNGKGPNNINLKLIQKITILKANLEYSNKQLNL
jgi:hypothetical protein